MAGFAGRCAQHVRPAKQIGTVQLVEQLVVEEIIDRLRHACALEISGACGKQPPKRGDPRADQRTVGQVSHPDDDVEAFLHRIGKAFGQCQLDLQIRVFQLQRGNDRHDITFAEGWETGDAQGAGDRTAEGRDLGMGIGNILEQAQRALMQSLAGIRQCQGSCRTDKQRHTQILLQRIDLPDDCRWRDRPLACGS